MALAEATAILDVWLDTPFDGGRHVRRLDQIKGFEERNFKP
jgi:ribose 5-phosphate isomerase RpiB